MPAVTTALLALAFAATPLYAQTPDPPRAFLLFVDDLHLGFKQTPRTRWVMQQVLARLTRAGDLLAVTTTGASSVSLAPTTDVTVVRAAISRITGNELNAREKPSPESSDESQHRADITSATAVDAIGGLAARPNHGEIVVLYITGGDGPGVTPPARVASAATDAGVRIVVVAIGELFPDGPDAAILPKDALEAMFARLALP